MTPEVSMEAFTVALNAGDVTRALLCAPFGYDSYSDVDMERGTARFTFTIRDGNTGVGSSLLEAVRNAVNPPEPPLDLFA